MKTMKRFLLITFSLIWAVGSYSLAADYPEDVTSKIVNPNFETSPNTTGGATYAPTGRLKTLSSSTSKISTVAKGTGSFIATSGRRLHRSGASGRKPCFCQSGQVAFRPY